MSEATVNTVQLQNWVARIRAGDAGARDELLRAVCGRLERLARAMLPRYPSVRRWEETADVFQNAALRLMRALRDVTPASTRDFFGRVLEGSIFYNSPLDYLPGIVDQKLLGRLRALRLIFCCGQGAWEERMLVETRELEQVLRDKSIPAWVDYWGGDVSHDWPWWHKQLVYFFGRWLDDDLMHRID